LPRNFDRIWIFGDSFSTPNVCVDPCDSFWGLAAELVGAKSILNVSRPGNSLDSVEQLLIGLQIEFNWESDLFLIGIPPLERITIFDNHKNTSYVGTKISTKTWVDEKFNVSCHHGLISLQNYGQDRQLILHNDRSWLETQVLRKLWLLTVWLDFKQAQYVMINLSKAFDPNNHWGPSEFVLNQMLEHPNCILFYDTYHGVNLDINKPPDFDQYGWCGHHGPVGNRHFFDKSLKKKIEELFC
jgi:hypothetical protein